MIAYVILSICFAQCSYGQLVANRVVNKPPLIIEQAPQEMPFREKHSFELPCIAVGYPPPFYRWLMDGKDYDPSGNDGRVAVQPGVGTLIFADPLRRDEAFYQCIATNDWGSAVTVKSYLRVSYIKPFPESGVRTYRPKLGDALTLPCVAPESFPRPNLYWALLDGERLRQVITDDRVTIDYTGSLHFANVKDTDGHFGKEYVCIAQNTVTREIQQGNNARIEPQGQTPLFNAPEEIYKRTSDEVTIVGQVYTIMCIFSGNPTPIVQWHRIGAEDGQLPENTRSDHYGQTLVFMGVVQENAGTYQCTGQNEIGYTPLQLSVSMRVEAAPAWVEGWKPESLEVAEHETARYQCKGVGIPDPLTIWYINGKILTSTDIGKDPKRLVGAHELVFYNITKLDSKVIQCNITNKHGYVFTNAYLNVMEEAPVIEQPPQIDLMVAEDQIVNLTCQVYGAPKPVVVWRKGTGEQLTGGRYRVFSDGNLLIRDISLVDAGEYSCTAKNRIDSVTAHGNLIVRRRTLIETFPQDVMVEMGTEAKFTCTATTDPAEIRNLRIEWAKDGQIIDYDRAQRIFKNIVDNSLTISGTISLDTGKYTCIAINGIDASEAGAILTVQEPPDPPSEVEVLCRSVVSNDNPDVTRIKAEISWQPGRENYAPILYHKLQFNTTFSADTWYDIVPPVPEREPNSTVPSPEPLPGILPNATRYDYLLSPYGNYTFRVIARNKVGYSEPSQHTTTVCTTEQDVPYKNPENVIAEGDKPDNLVIFWTPMAQIEHNGRDFKYLVSYKPADGSDDPITVTVGRPDAWHYVVEDRTMETYKEYLVRVKAKNAVGESKDEAEWVTGYTGEGVPLVSPTDVMVEPDTVESKMAVLVWTQVDTSPDRVRGYFRGYRIQYGRVSEWPDNIREEDVIINKGRTLYPRPRYRREIISLNTTIHYLMRDLPPNNMVRLQIRVLNKYYVGPPSEAIEFKTLEGEPGPPAKFDVLARGPTYFELEWERPKQFNGVLLGYHISYQIVSGLNLGGKQIRDRIDPFPDDEKPGIRLTGLKPDTYYRVFLTAATQAGQGEHIFLDMNTLPAGIPSAPTFDVISWNNNSFTVEWEPSRGINPGSVFFVEYRIRGYFKWRRTEQIYLSNELKVWPVDSGTDYQVRVVATNGMGDEAASEYLEVVTKGLAPGKFKLSVSFWFYGIFIALLLIIAFIILLFFAKKRTDKWYDSKEDAIAEQMRQIQAEEAALQMGILNQGSQEYLYSQSSLGPDLKAPLEERSYEVADEEDPEFFAKHPPQKIDYPDHGNEPPHNEKYYPPRDAVPTYDQAVGVHQSQRAPPTPVTDEYAVVQRKGRGGNVQLERSEGEKGSKDTFV